MIENVHKNREMIENVQKNRAMIENVHKRVVCSRLVHTVLAYQAISNSGTGLSWFLISGQLYQAGN